MFCKLRAVSPDSYFPSTILMSGSPRSPYHVSGSPLFTVSTAPHNSPIPPPSSNITGYWVNQYPNTQFYPSSPEWDDSSTSPGPVKNTPDTPAGFKRKTTQTIQINFPKDVYLGTGDYTIKIPKLGDMITRLRVVGNFNNNTVGESIINQIDFIVKSNVLESLKGDFIKVDNAMNLSLEKIATSNALVNGTFSMIDIPFYLIEKGFFMVTEPDVRLSFTGDPNFKITNGCLLVDYTLVENPLSSKYFQRIRQVQDISVIGSPSCSFIKIDTAFTGPVYQLYFTVENLNTGTLVPNILNVKFNERFNLSGNYLQYTEPMKRYKGIPSIPMYLYTFALNPENIHEASGQMNFSRLDQQRFEITLVPIVDPVKVTIWAQAHNFVNFFNSNCLPIFQSGEFTLSSSQITTTIPSLPIKLNQEMINNYAKLNISYSNVVPLSNTIALNQVVSTVDNIVSGLVLSSPGYSNVTVNMNQSSLSPFFVTFKDATIINVKTDPQNGNVIMLLSNGAISDQKFGVQTPSFTGNPMDITLDLYANPVVSYSDGHIQTYQRQTYVPLSTVNLGASSTNIALYYDGSVVWAAYYSNPNCVLLNLTTGISISNNFGLGTLNAKKFCNSSDYVQYLSSSQTYVFQFSTGKVFTGYFYNDGTKFVKTPDGGTTLVLNNCSATGITFAYDMVYAFDSFQNFYFNIKYSSDIFHINTGSQTLNSYLGGTGLTVTNGVQYYRYTMTPYGTIALIITILYEDPQTHLMICAGYNSANNIWYQINDVNLKNFIVSQSYSFIFTFDSLGFIFPTKPNLNLNSLNNYVNPSIFYDPSVFETSNNFIRYPPLSMRDATPTIVSSFYTYPSAYTFSAIATSTRNFNGYIPFVSANYINFVWGGYTGYPSNYSVVITIGYLQPVTVPSYLQFKTIVGLSPLTTYTWAAYWIDNLGVQLPNSSNHGTFTTLAQNDPSQFDDYFCSTTPTQIIITYQSTNVDTINSYIIVKYKKSTDSNYTTTGYLTFESLKTTPFIITDTVQYDIILTLHRNEYSYSSLTKTITGTEYGAGTYTISASENVGEPSEYPNAPLFACFGNFNGPNYWKTAGYPNAYITIQTPPSLKITGVYISDNAGSSGRYTVDAISGNFTYNILTNARLSSNKLLYFPNGEIIINPYTWRITYIPGIEWRVYDICLIYSGVTRLPGGSATITTLNSSSVSWNSVNFNANDTLNIYTSLDLINWTLLTTTTVGTGSYAHFFSSGTYVSLSVMGDTVYQDYNTNHSVYSQYIDSRLPGGSATLTSFTNTLVTFSINWSFLNFNPSTTLYIYYSLDLTNWAVLISFPLSNGNVTSPGSSHPIFYLALVVTGDPTYKDYNTNFSVYTIIPAI